MLIIYGKIFFLCDINKHQEKIVKSIVKWILFFYMAMLFGSSAIAAGNEAAVQEPTVSTVKVPKKENALKRYIERGKLSEAEAAKIKEEIKNEIISEIKAGFKEEIKAGVKLNIKEEFQIEAKIEKSKEVEIAKKEKEKDIYIGGYTQIQYTDNNASGNASSFNVARTRLIIRKKLDDKLYFYLQTNLKGNAANNANSTNSPKLTLLDATINYQAAGLEIRGGQFTTPFGLENMIGARKKFLINSSQVLNGDHEMASDDLRDVGVMFIQKQKDNPFTYYLSITNGEVVNNCNDSNDEKTFTGRILYNHYKFWQFGAAARSGKRYKAAFDAAKGITLYGSNGGATPAQNFNKLGCEFDFKYKKDKWFWQGEYQWLKTGLAGRISDLKGRGGYVETGYMMTKNLELALKEDVFLPDTSNLNSKKIIHSAGLNWYFNKAAKLQVVYEKHKETPEVNNDFWASQLQLEF